MIALEIDLFINGELFALIYFFFMLIENSHKYIFAMYVTKTIFTYLIHQFISKKIIVNSFMVSIIHNDRLLLTKICFHHSNSYLSKSDIPSRILKQLGL